MRSENRCEIGDYIWSLVGSIGALDDLVASRTAIFRN